MGAAWTKYCGSRLMTACRRSAGVDPKASMERVMHDIDRTQLEFNPEMESFEYEQFEQYGSAIRTL